MQQQHLNSIREVILNSRTIKRKKGEEIPKTKRKHLGEMTTTIANERFSE